MVALLYYMILARRKMKYIPEMLIAIGLIGIVLITGYLNIIIGIYILSTLLIGAGIWFAKGRG